MLGEKTREIDTHKSADAPLTPDEIESLRQHFRFLREHRKLLRLRVNATEDLLLNGAREPTHRGVCQHLLAKVERGAVIAAVGKLEPVAGARLLAGVIRFSSEIEYVLLFLEKIRLSTSPDEATAALSQGLKRIDFSEVSSAQMRRVLGLLADLFDESQRPQLLLGLLESRSFRDAIDGSIADLPEALASLVAPLRAAQAVILHGKSNVFEADVLREGVHRLLEADDRDLLRHPPEARRRLFLSGIQICHAPEHASHRGLKALLSSFRSSPERHAELGIALVRHFLLARDESEARDLLKSLAAEHPESPLAGRWLEILDAPRIDRFALSKAPDPEGQAPGRRRRIPAVWIDTMREVSLQIGVEEHADGVRAAADLQGGIRIPGVAPVIASGTTPDGAPYCAVTRPGPDLRRSLSRKGGLALEQAMSVCWEATSILWALAAAGIELSDANSRRFDLEPGGRLWLVDLCGGRSREAEAAERAHLELARGLCRYVLDRARRYIPPREVREAMERSSSCVELARAFERRPGA